MKLLEAKCKISQFLQIKITNGKRSNVLYYVDYDEDVFDLYHPLTILN